MNLILWRHAEAEPGAPDIERALTAKGKRQAEKMGAWLDRHLPQNCRILSSPARRTVETAQALGRKFTCSTALGIASTAEQLIAEAGWPDGSKSVLIVGHQPVLGQAISLILTGTKQDWTIRKGNIIWISKKNKENLSAFIRAVLAPELLDT